MDPNSLLVDQSDMNALFAQNLQLRDDNNPAGQSSELSQEMEQELGRRFGENSDLIQKMSMCEQEYERMKNAHQMEEVRMSMKLDQLNF